MSITEAAEGYGSILVLWPHRVPKFPASPIGGHVSLMVSSSRLWGVQLHAGGASFPLTSPESRLAKIEEPIAKNVRA